ncbi:hypothetical protein [Polynucleobacter sp. HIN5]|uniref:hypothetical protein n=1 Tax=Polynucleobacter sp. HIN5 TaxID=3047864 RepID=UPI0025733C2E|nr:hypothetical protein [Polynucleobacter sp. HIN5]BEI33734.1 hypothetical protein PHIN5_11020 [Polynucleobacter sp. HIN5]
MLRKQACKYCAGLFQPLRVGHIYCSDTCRKLKFKAKKASETKKKLSRRLEKKLGILSASAFGKFLVREIRRAGTVQILHGHTAASLADLVSLKRRCTSAAGFKDGESLGAYELSHIYPVGNSQSKHIGLLSPKNLTIAPKEFNRKHSTKLPSCGYLGESIPRSILNPQWSIRDNSSSQEILALARKYIGADFDAWLGKHNITLTQKQGLIRSLKKAGYHEERLRDLNLKELQAIANDEDVGYFHMTASPAEINMVLMDELNRLKIGNPLLTALEYLEHEEWDSFYNSKFKFIGFDREKKAFKKYLITQSLACLHGQPYSEVWKKKAVLRHFKEQKESPQKLNIDDEDAEIPL